MSNLALAARGVLGGGPDEGLGEGDEFVSAGIYGLENAGLFHRITPRKTWRRYDLGRKYISMTSLPLFTLVDVRK